VLSPTLNLSHTPKKKKQGGKVGRPTKRVIQEDDYDYEEIAGDEDVMDVVSENVGKKEGGKRVRGDAESFDPVGMTKEVVESQQSFADTPQFVIPPPEPFTPQQQQPGPPITQVPLNLAKYQIVVDRLGDTLALSKNYGSLYTKFRNKINLLGPSYNSGNDKETNGRAIIRHLIVERGWLPGPQAIFTDALKFIKDNNI
jgi:hypothetical protein